MKICPKCNANLDDSVKFCQICGCDMTGVEAQYQAPQEPQFNEPQYQPQYNQTPQYTQPQYQPVYQPCTSVSEEQLPEKFKPISPWAYFGLQLLFSIPLIGFIFLIVFSCSNENINRRNFARSYWCVLALSVHPLRGVPFFMPVLCTPALIRPPFPQAIPCSRLQATAL